MEMQQLMEHSVTRVVLRNCSLTRETTTPTLQSLYKDRQLFPFFPTPRDNDTDQLLTLQLPLLMFWLLLREREKFEI